MKDLGQIHYYLGVAIEQDGDSSFVMHQKQYIHSMIEKYGIAEAKIVATPMDVSMVWRRRR